MNIVSQKYAHDLVARFRQQGRIPGSTEHLPPERVASALETWAYNYDQLRLQDDGPEDLAPGLGRVVTHTEISDKCLRTCVDYWGDATDGEVSMLGQMRGFNDGDRHVYCRYTPGAIDSLEVEARNEYVEARSWHLDRRHPQESTHTSYNWENEGFILAHQAT